MNLLLFVENTLKCTAEDTQIGGTPEPSCEFPYKPWSFSKRLEGTAGLWQEFAPQTQILRVAASV